jgi:patatin-related protein
MPAAARTAAQDAATGHETRVGLVMYGGVSLAIYENGVAREMYRAAHGLGVYGVIQSLLGTRIRIDVISGTSAGGVNGILLAFALANGVDFTKSSDLWRQHGDILTLLRDPADKTANSLLDSRGAYHPALVAGLRALLESRGAGGACSEIDLYVTGTDVRGVVTTTCDDLGNLVDVKDHRAMFKLSYREGRKNEFGEDPQLPGVDLDDRIEALATLARITSCFPVAFEPVLVDAIHEARAPEKGKRRTDYLLTRWGKLRDRCVFLDGGILDNKPFSYTIDGIFSRTTEGPVDRYLMYVEPNPERFRAASGGAFVPNVMQAALAALIEIPGYESIGADLRAIADRNTRVSHYREIREALGYLGDADDHHGATLDAIGASDPARMRMYQSSRLVQLRTRAVDAILQRERASAFYGSPEDRRAARVLAESFNQWPGSGAETLDEFDIYFRQRRTTHLIYALYELSFVRTPARDYGPLLACLNQLFQLQEITRFALEDTIDRYPFDLTHLASTDASASVAIGYWTQLQQMMRGVLHLDARIDETIGRLAQEGTPAERQVLRENFRRLIYAQADACRKQTYSATTELAHGPRNVLHAFDAMERMLLEHCIEDRPNDPLWIEYERFLWLDANLFPIEQSGGIQAKDVLRTVRISPIDARLGLGARKSLEEKLCGNMLGHFAGFFKRSWSSNDIMWGRLDAVSQIAESLLLDEKLARANVDTLTREDLDRIFPTAQLADLDALAKLAAGLSTASKAQRHEFVELLITIAQGEILHEEIPIVVSDAIQQQSDWNAYDISAAPLERRFYDQRAGRWTVGVRQLDRAVLEYARAELTRSLDMPATRPSRWTVFHRESRSVGLERFPGDIPMSVMLEVLSRAALVMRNCMLDVIPERNREFVRRSLVYRFCVDYPLRVLHALVSFQRTAPEYAQVTLTATLAVCLTLIGVLIVHPSLKWNLANFFAFVALPVIIVAPLLLAIAPAKLSLGTRIATYSAVLAATIVVFGTGVLAWSVSFDFATADGIIESTRVTPAFLASWIGWTVKHHFVVTSATVALIAGFVGSRIASLLRRRRKEDLHPG